ncbi:MAG: glycosyltransferase [Syntrophales bacterium]|jgi:glycosyltransferase involved in cell wall biosynthesis|nr:glycosyltransferase [Syntrophales bacterium]
MDDPLKKTRKKFRQWNNTRRLKAELAGYEAAFEARRLKIPDDAAILSAIKERFPDLAPKPPGELSIIAIFHNYNWENSSLLPALEKLGRVRHYDWFDEFPHTRHDWRKSLKAKMNRNLVERIGRWAKAEKPDVIFTYLSGEIVSPETIRALRSWGIPLIHFSLNDKEHFVGKVRCGLAFGSRDICPLFDLCWTSTEDALKKYCVDGALPVYLPEGANPDIHKPCDCEKTIDVSFVGQCYGNRPETISRLQQEGIHVEAFGYGWPNGPLSTEEMVHIYSKSRINLGFGGVEGHNETFCLKGRDFEIPMSGGLYLTEYHQELEPIYDLGKEIVVYQGFDDLVRAINRLLAHPEEAEAIRAAGRRRALAAHTWEKRFETIFSLLKLLRI